jgi:hypothetical protein
MPGPCNSNNNSKLRKKRARARARPPARHHAMSQDQSALLLHRNHPLTSRQRQHGFVKSEWSGKAKLSVAVSQQGVVGSGGGE